MLAVPSVFYFLTILVSVSVDISGLKTSCKPEKKSAIRGTYFAYPGARFAKLPYANYEIFCTFRP
jgi:hypothetical protein